MGNKIEQSGEGNAITGVVLGDAVASTITAYNQHSDQGVRELAPFVQRFLQALSASDVDEDEKQAVTRAAQDAANATGDDRKPRWTMLKGVVRGALQLPGMAAKAIE